VRRTVPPSAEIQANIDNLLSRGMVDDPQKVLSELARLGARLIIQRAVEEEFDTWLGRDRYERRPEVSGKWVGRYRAEIELGLRDRSSAPHRISHRTSEERVEAIAALRRLRFTGPEIAEVLGMALSTVSGILTRIGMGKPGRLGLEPAHATSARGPVS